MATIKNITAEFTKLIPAVKADFIDFQNRRFNRLTEQYGTLSYHTSRKMNNHDQMAFRSLSSFLHTAGRTGHMGDPLVINESYLDKIAQEHAEAQIASFTNKLEAKLDDLEQVKLEMLDISRFTFVITGKRGNASVRVEQQVVFKCSSKGTHFCQWPARIYVNGKFTSEKAYKEMPVVAKTVKTAPAAKQSKKVKLATKANPYREGSQSFATFQMILETPKLTLSEYAAKGARMNTVYDAARKGLITLH